MRIRNVKPGFYRSDDIDALSWEQRFLFVALFSYVDDNGVGRDRESDICADLFAGDFSVDPTETLGKVRQGLLALVKQRLVVRYEVDGKRYLFITGWDAHQYVKNPNPERYPRPDKALLSLSVDAGENRSSHSVDPEPTLPTVVGSRSQVVGSKSLVVGRSQRTATDEEIKQDFAIWYALFPKRQKRPDAMRAYVKARKRASAEELLAGAERWAEVFEGDNQFCPLPATWLNADQWNDETPKRKTGDVRQQQTDDMFARAARRAAEADRKAIA